MDFSAKNEPYNDMESVVLNTIPEKILSGSFSLETVSLTIGIKIFFGSILAVNSTHCLGMFLQA